MCSWAPCGCLIPHPRSRPTYLNKDIENINNRNATALIGLQLHKKRAEEGWKDAVQLIRALSLPHWPRCAFITETCSAYFVKYSPHRKIFQTKHIGLILNQSQRYKGEPGVCGQLSNS
jgi:hypothetical protein